MANFNDVVESVYNLSLEERIELKNLLEYNITDSRREEILASYNKAKQEYNAGISNFSSDTDELLKML